MPISIDDPIVQSSVLPLALALLLTGVLRFAFGAEHGSRVANGAVGLSFAILIALVQGVIFPPVASTHKLAYLVGAAAVLGILVDLMRWRAVVPLFAVLSAASLWWINQTRWGSADSALLVKIGLVFVVSVAVVARLWALRGEGLTPVVMLLLACGGYGAMALMGASALLATLAFTLMASLGGFALWNWPRHRFAIGGGLLFAGAGGLMLLVNQALLLTKTSPLALCLLLPLLFVNRMVGPLSQRWQLGDLGRPVLIAVACLPVVLIALGVSFVVNPIDPSSGY